MSSKKYILISFHNIKKVLKSTETSHMALHLAINSLSLLYTKLKTLMFPVSSNTFSLKFYFKILYLMPHTIYPMNPISIALDKKS